VSREAFFEAVTAGEVERVREMLAADSSLATAVNEGGVSAVLLALYYQKADVAAAILEVGPELTVWEAAATGRTGRVRELVGADPALVNAYAADGFYPLGLAIFFGHPDTALALLDLGADVDQAARNAVKVAPLHAAAAAKQTDLACELLERGADPNVRQQAGFTPLHEAARQGNFTLVDRLIAHGADVDAEADDGRRPLTFAQESGVSEVAELLESYGATT
jgi:ankyrin repeat protein